MSIEGLDTEPIALCLAQPPGEGSGGENKFRCIRSKVNCLVLGFSTRGDSIILDVSEGCFVFGCHLSGINLGVSEASLIDLCLALPPERKKK